MGLVLFHKTIRLMNDFHYEIAGLLFFSFQLFIKEMLVSTTLVSLK